MKVTFLGTGTSHGIPVIGCQCSVCKSTNPANNRYRSSILVSQGHSNILIDISPEFRLQAIRADIREIDAVLLTHSHADHIHGIDDIRALSYKKRIPFYCKESTKNEIKERFPYIFNPPIQQGGGLPQIYLKEIEANKEFKIRDLSICPIEVMHGNLKILGYRIGSFAYITDCSFISDKSIMALTGVKTLVIGALRYRSHPTHFSIDEALNLIKKISPKRAYLTHLCHDVEHCQLEKELPGEVKPARDGLVLKIKL